MKETNLSNPEILMLDDKIRKLDEIVTEVKESEEWEAVSMSIYSVAWERGMERGIEQGIERGMQSGTERKLIELICKKLRKEKSVEMIAEELEEELDFVQKVVELVAQFAPDYEVERVWDAWIKGR